MIFYITYIVNEFIHVDLTIDIKHLFKTNINSECRAPLPPGGCEIKFLTLPGVCPNTT